MLSFLISSDINYITGDIYQFSMMNAGAPSNSHYRNSFNESNMYSISFIHLPSNINFGEIYYNTDFNTLNISSNISVLEWGELGEFQNNHYHSFTASEKKLQLSILKKTNSKFNFCGSIGYFWSNYDSYTSSFLIYTLGIDRVGHSLIIVFL